MANTPSSKKRVRTNAVRNEINTARLSRIKGFIRKVEEAIAGGDQTVAKTAFQNAEPEIMRGATKGIFHKKTASRKVSRLAARVKALSN